MPYYSDGSDPFYHDPFYAEVFGADAPPPLVLAPEVYESAWKKYTTKKWFTDPAWTNGPPRWQAGVAGSAVALGLVFLGLALGKKR